MSSSESSETTSSPGKASNKKEILLNSINAAGIAANLFDRFDRFRKSSSTTPAPTANAASSSNDAGANTSLLTNLAFSFHKNVLNNSNSLSSSLNKTLASNKNSSMSNSIAIYDDEELDYDVKDTTPYRPSTMPQLPVSQSDFSLSKAKGSTSYVEPLNHSFGVSDDTNKIASSTSLYKLDSNENSKENEETNVSLRNRFLAKKKSAELSIENMKNKVLSPSSLVNSNASTPSSQVSQQDEKLLSSQDLAKEFSLGTESLSSVSLSGQESESHNEHPKCLTPRNSILTITPTINAISRHQVTSDASSSTNEKLESDVSSSREHLTSDASNDSISLKKFQYYVPIVAMIISLYLFTFKNTAFMIMIFYAFGLVTGVLLALIILYVLFKLEILHHIPQFKQYLRKTNESISTTAISSKSFKDTSLDLQNLLVQTVYFKEKANFDGIYKGWMNELKEVYNPETYFLNKTRSVYVNLDGYSLRLQTTSSKVPKRAIWNESLPSCKFNELRTYDLTNCEVCILPQELVRKRYWSKKYPICLKGVKLTSKASPQQEKVKTPINPSDNLSLHSSSISSSNSFASHRQLTNSTQLPTSQSSNSLLLNSQMNTSTTLILFARTDREKEEWFRLFRMASTHKLIDSSQYLKQYNARLTSSLNSHAASDSNLLLSYDASNQKLVYNKILSEQLKKPHLMPASASATSIHSNDNGTPTKTDGEVNIIETTASNTTVETQTDNGLIYEKSLAFFNTFLIRSFADFFTEKKWIDFVKNKIQKKLWTIKVPYFMEELHITDIDLGGTIPLIKKTSEPWYDEKGLWVHLDIDYNGGMQMSLATKLNLMKLKSNNSSQHSNSSSTASSPSAVTSSTISTGGTMFSFKNSSEDEPIVMSNLSTNSSQVPTTGSIEEPPVQRKRHLGIYDSDEEDSAESSGDEYVHTGFGKDDENKLKESVNPSKKLLNIVNKIAASNYFQKATENKYIKMAMWNVSNCQLLLTVEVKKISGTLAINIPPHPSDRIWYGFVTNPTMVLTATPQVGDKEVSYSAITDWIAEKLKHEFQKVLVFPNMDDFYIPLLNSELNTHA